MPDTSTPTTRPAKWYVVTEPQGTAIDITLVKEHLRLDPNDNPSELGLYLAAATDYAEGAMEIALAQRTIVANFYGGEPLILPRTPLLAVNSITDANGAPITQFSTKFKGHRCTIVVPGSAAYPITVNYDAGYRKPYNIPASIQLGILTHVGTLYENRESISDRAKLPVPHSLEAFYKLKCRSPQVG